MTGAEPHADRVGPYRLVERIGEGGMGVVHLGLDPSGREVAIKVLKSAVAGDTTALRRLAREVDTMRRVHSPHVAEVIDADVTAERPYVVTQYVPGRSLERVVAEDGPLRGRPLERLAAGLASALGAIHSAGVVHRDLKPGNVMLVDDQPIVIDFGIAHAVDLTRLTATGLVIGTPGYLAPEIVEGEEAGPASDVHAWASTVTFGATGRPPFGTGPFETIFFRIMQGKVDLDGVPEAMLPLLRSAFALNPAERPTAVKLAQLAGRISANATMATKVDSASPAQTRMFSGTDAMPAFPSAPAPAPPPPAPAPTRPARPEDFRGQLPPAAPPPPVPRDTWGGDQPQGPYGPYGQMDTRSAHRPEPRHRPDEPKPFGWYRLLSGLLLVSTVALAAMVPMVTLIVVVIAVLLLRTGDRLAKDLTDRRTRRGPSSSDALAMIVKSPWAIVRAALSTGLLGLLALAVGFAVGLVFLVTDTQISRVGTFAMAAFVLVTFLGPGGAAPRRQMARVWGVVLPRQQAAMIAAAALALLTLFLAAVAFKTLPDWVPLSSNPFQSLQDLKGWVQDLFEIGDIFGDIRNIG